MPAKISVSFPAADLARSTAFYTAIGATVNPLFTSDDVVCLVWDDDLQFMLLTREFFAGFTDKRIADPSQSAQVQIALALDSREEVDAVVRAGLSAGGLRATPRAGPRLHVRPGPRRPGRQQPGVRVHGGPHIRALIPGKVCTTAIFDAPLP